MSAPAINPSESTTAKATPKHDEVEAPAPVAETPVSDSPSPPRPRKRKWPWIIGLTALVIALAVGIPWLRESLTTVSTDDAYVNGHVTFVAPRVSGQVKNVFVDDNNAVHKGDLLVELDPEPFQVQVNIAEASLKAAKADLVAAQASVRANEALARSLRFGLEHAIEDVDDKISTLKRRAATLEAKKASLTKAQSDYDRGKRLS